MVKCGYCQPGRRPVARTTLVSGRQMRLRLLWKVTALACTLHLTVIDFLRRYHPRISGVAQFAVIGA